VMPQRERRKVDCVLQRHGEPPRIIEFDESQHFNCYRAMTLRRYPRSVRIAFDRGVWLQACDAKARLEGGGFGRPKPPLFPHEDGRHRQRAYRDALADLLPAAEHNRGPNGGAYSSWRPGGSFRVSLAMLEGPRPSNPLCRLGSNGQQLQRAMVSRPVEKWATFAGRKVGHLRPAAPVEN